MAIRKALTGADQQDIELSLQMSRRMLRTLATLSVGRVPFDQAVAILKQAYVQAAIHHLQKAQPGKRLTRSAIALLTGMDGRTIANLLDAADSEAEPERQVKLSPHAQVLGSWASGKRWRDPATGKPMPLTIYGAGNTFQALVKATVGKSISYSMILETLIQHGNVRKLGDNQVEMVDRLFRSASDLSLKRQANRMVHGVGKNIINGLEKQDTHERWPRGMVWNQRVRPEELAELRKQVLTLLRDKHTYEVGELIDQHADLDDGPEQATAGVGWYYWEDS